MLQVQRNLQLRIEAQGKYLQTILEKAKETLAGHTATSPDLKAAHAELTELASKVISDPSSFAAATSHLPQRLTGLNPPELFNNHHHASDNINNNPMQGVNNSNNNTNNHQAMQPSGASAALPSRHMSDSSSQKSHLTNLTNVQEDSGGVSGGGDQHTTAPGIGIHRNPMTSAS